MAKVAVVKTDRSGSEAARSSALKNIEPNIVGDFSMERHQFWEDRRFLKFFNAERFQESGTTAYRPVQYDLSTDPHRAPDCARNPLNGFQGLLRWLTKARFSLEGTDVITTRHVLKQIMQAACGEPTELEFQAAKIGRVLFLFDPRPSQAPTSNHDRSQEVAGFKFEHCLLTDAPSDAPAPFEWSSRDDHLIRPNDKFRCVLNLITPTHGILYSSEMDGFQPTAGSGEDKEALDLSRDGDFVELKTSNRNREDTFRRYKYPKWWIQSFLGCNRKVLVGFKDRNLVVNELKEFCLDDLERSAVKWSKGGCLSYLDDVVGALKREIQEEGVVYQVSKPKISDQLTFGVTESDPFVPGWFYDNAVEIPGLY